MDDQTLAQKESDFAEKMQLIAELTEEAAELHREIRAEYERRNQTPGTVHQFRPRPSNGPEPTDQGSV